MDDLIARQDEFQRCLVDRDVDGAGRVLDEDYALVLVQPAAAVMPRAMWLAMLPDYVVHDYGVEERMLDVDGDTATSLQRVHMTATVRGQDRSGQFVLTDVWRKRADGWRLWRRTSTPLTAGDLPRPDAD